MTASSASTTDVVIIGSGPSGLMAALWMARSGVKTRIIDARATKVFRGQADGMQTGTLDIFDSFGIADDLYKNAAPAMEMTFWAGSKDSPLKRVARLPKWYPELGQYHLVHTSQGNTERALLDGMKAFNGLEVERGVIASAIAIDESSVHDPQAHAITLTVKHLTDEELASSSSKFTVPQPGDFNYTLADEPYLKRKVTGKEGSTETIKAKFVIGTDGSRSWTRQALGFDFLGDGDDNGDESMGGILDCVATSNFPDIHIQSMIAKDGRGAGFVPRENGLLRIAAPVANKSEATPEAIIKSLKEILSPYELNVTHVDWCGVFGTSRRVASSASKHSRIFLAGDALHVHSPRAGIGMNFSIQDAYNLGWKIAHVVKGISPLAILKTYDEERGLTSKQLISFDKALSEQSPLGANFSVKGTRQGLQDNLPFSSTTAIEYEAGLLVAKEGGTVNSKQYLAPGIPVGRRLPSQTVERHANGEPVGFGKCFPSDGRYRIVVFAGNISNPEQLRRVEHLSKMLKLPEALLQRLDGRAIAPQDVYEILIVHSASRDDVEVTDLPPFLLKHSDPFDHVFVDNNQSRTWALTDAYGKYGISQDRGCLVLVRPDRHVTYIGELEDATELVQLISSILD
ncbi:phenol 2-monooxygenase [Penicillium samsonianum]|uniref:phenol 2-monooxygenase n=1 Tax=Penicillium samsonianum TaxID=1882272 RepID=UPI0025473483|nr:phenol 2-monooxygenase [Penicillium samsonianum]KAJ6142979.1 phenol 2-monooxygenase [Penicillium samsonianum]